MFTFAGRDRPLRQEKVRLQRRDPAPQLLTLSAARHLGPALKSEHEINPKGTRQRYPRGQFMAGRFRVHFCGEGARAAGTTAGPDTRSRPLPCSTLPRDGRVPEFGRGQRSHREQLWHRPAHGLGSRMFSENTPSLALTTRSPSYFSTTCLMLRMPNPWFAESRFVVTGKPSSNRKSPSK